MKNFKAKFMGFVKNIYNGLVFGYFLSLLFLEIWSVFDFLDSGDHALLDFFFVINLIIIFCTIIINIIKFRGQSIHRIDSELIGNNFIGFSKKSRLFRENVEYFFYKNYPRALEGFRSIDENYKLSVSEKAILYYYIARCYDLMGYYTNAYRYYDMSSKNGFNDDSITLLKARCLGYMGDIEQALEIYSGINQETNRYYIFVRTDIADMYLHNRQPEQALKWYLEAVEHRENYAAALGGCSLAYLMLGNQEESEKYYKYAIMQNINDMEGFKAFYKEVKQAAIKGSDSVV